MTSYDNIRSALRSSGLIFSVTFVKKNGETRKMVARTGVRRSSGVGMVGNRFPMYMNVWDMQKREYRKINVRTVREVKMFGQEFKFNFPMVVQTRLFE